MKESATYARWSTRHLLAHRPVVLEPGVKLRQRCESCGGRFKSTLRVEVCPVTSGCRGRTTVVGEHRG